MRRKVSPDAGMDRSGCFEDDSIRRLRRDEGEAAMDMEFRSLSFVVLQRRTLPGLLAIMLVSLFQAIRQLGMVMTDPIHRTTLRLWHGSSSMDKSYVGDIIIR